MMLQKKLGTKWRTRSNKELLIWSLVIQSLLEIYGPRAVLPQLGIFLLDLSLFLNFAWEHLALDLNLDDRSQARSQRGGGGGPPPLADQAPPQC